MPKNTLPDLSKPTVSQSHLITLRAECLCKAHSFIAEVQSSSLPLEASACHCHSCRHTVGALYSMDLPWPQSLSDVDVSGLKVFKFSDKIDVYFCGTCSSPFFFGHSNAKPPSYELGVFSGVLKNNAVEGDVSLVTLKDNIYVGDTGDGGAAPWLRMSNTKCYKERSIGEEYTFPGESALAGYEKEGQDCIPIRCKCNGVNFKLFRYKVCDDDEKLPWYVDPKTHKYIADHCVCDSCRLFSGIEIYDWTFAGLSNISFKDGNSVETTLDLKKLVDDADPSIGTLKYYRSSPDVQRYFCSNCSACVFYAVDDRPDMLDVAVGILDAPEGARAEGMLAWRFSKTDFQEDVKGGWREALVDSVDKAAKKWRDERGYPEL